MCRYKKWNILSNLIDELAIDPTLSTSKMSIEKICYAPHIGYSSWIFKCDGVYVALFNGCFNNYSFHMPVTLLDVVRAKVTEWYEDFCYFVDNGVWRPDAEASQMDEW